MSVVLQTANTKPEEEDQKEAEKEKDSPMADSPSHEFVSDSMRASNTDIEEVKEGMKKLAMQSAKGELTG